MKIRIAKKIMKNVRLYPGMHRVYGLPRVQKENNLSIKYLSKDDEVFNKWRILSNKNPSLALIRMLKLEKEKTQK